jgi:hypothetical protein
MSELISWVATFDRLLISRFRQQSFSSAAIIILKKSPIHLHVTTPTASFGMHLHITWLMDFERYMSMTSAGCEGFTRHFFLSSNVPCPKRFNVRKKLGSTCFVPDSWLEKHR